MNKKTGIIVAVIAAICVIGIVAWFVGGKHANDPNVTAEGSAIDEPVPPPPTGIITETQEESDIPDLGDLTSDYYEIIAHNGDQNYTQKSTSTFEAANTMYRYYVVDELTTSAADSILDGKSDSLKNPTSGTESYENGVTITYVAGEIDNPESQYLYELQGRRLVGESDGLSTYLFLIVQSREKIDPHAFCELLSDSSIEINQY